MFNLGRRSSSDGRLRKLIEAAVFGWFVVDRCMVLSVAVYLCTTPYVVFRNSCVAVCGTFVFWSVLPCDIYIIGHMRRDSPYCSSLSFVVVSRDSAVAVCRCMHAHMARRVVVYLRSVSLQRCCGRQVPTWAPQSDSLCCCLSVLVQ